MVKRIYAALISAILLLGPGGLGAFGADPTILHHFAGGTDDGEHPNGTLVQCGSKLFGTTPLGGADARNPDGSPNNNHGLGTVFSVNPDGSDFDVLHAFLDWDDGVQPSPSLAVLGSTLYGMTQNGGGKGDDDIYGQGTVFRINADGNGYQKIHVFRGADGAVPVGTLTVIGSKLYGMTARGGNGEGTIFSLNPDGGDFLTLHHFTGGGSGSRPAASLTAAGSKLYGMTPEGGGGFIFSLNPGGTDFKILHSFSGGADGARPYGSLVCSGTRLYGIASQGGVSQGGVLFSIDLEGNDFTPLHGFSGGSFSDTPIIVGSTIYGVGGYVDGESGGVVYTVQTDGTGYDVLHRFSVGDSEPYYLNGSLTPVGSKLMGVTHDGGNAGYGTIYALQVGPATTSVSWANAASGSWDTPANWQPAAVPAALSDVIIQGSTPSALNPFTVTGPAAASTISSLNLGGSGGTATLNLTKPLTVTDALGIGSVGSLIAQQTNLHARTLTNAGSLAQKGGSIALDSAFTQTPTGTLKIVLSAAGVPGSSLVTAGTSANLAGTLQVLLGNSGGQDFIPANADNISLIGAPSVTGRFASIGLPSANKGFAEAQYTSQRNTSNHQSAGLFAVTYEPDKVVLSDFHRIHTLSVGVTDQLKGSTQYRSINGIAAAEGVRNAFRYKAGVTSATLLPLRAVAGVNNKANKQAVLSAIRHEIDPANPDRLRAGDTFVFYLHAHGTFDDKSPSGQEQPLSRQVTGPVINGTIHPVLHAPTTTETAMVLGDMQIVDFKNETIGADEFAALFDRTDWNGVNKLFIMDTCYSGGFWEGEGGIQYLKRLPHAAIIYSSPEFLLSFSASATANGTNIGGELGYIVSTVLGKSTSRFLDFDDLLSEVIATEQDLLSRNMIGMRGARFPAASSPVGNVFGYPLDSYLEPSFSGTAGLDFSLGFPGADSAPVSGEVTMPRVTTKAAQSVTANSASLRGAVTAGTPEAVWFEYGLTESYGQQTASLSGAQVSPEMEVSQTATALQAHSPYHFRLVARFNGQETRGDDKLLYTTDSDPVAVADFVVVPGAGSYGVAVLANDADADGDPLAVTATGQGTAGKVQARAGTVSYSGNATFSGTDTFTYTVSDGFGGFSTASVSVVAPNFTGLLNGAAGPDGKMKVKLSTSRAFSASMTVGGKDYSFHGVFDARGQYSGAVPRKNLDPVSVSLSLVPAAAVITGTVDDGESHTVDLRNAVLRAPADLPSRCTVLLEPPAETARPKGYGYGSLTVSRSGAIKLAGKLGDGRAFSAGAPLRSDRTCAFYALVSYPKSAKGLLGGNLDFTAQPASDGAGLLRWVKPLTEGSYVPFAFDTSTMMKASRYTKPGKTHPLFTFSGLPNSARFFLGSGPPVPGGYAITVSSNGTLRVNDPAPGGLSLSLNSTTGLFTGGVDDPALAPKRATIGGAVYQKENFGGAGFVSGFETSGEVTLVPQ